MAIEHILPSSKYALLNMSFLYVPNSKGPIYPAFILKQGS